MPIITRLVAGKHNQNRVNLYLDNRFAFSLSLDQVVRHQLTKGIKLSQDALNDLLSEDNFSRVYAKIRNYLSYRPRSVSEVTSRLQKYQQTKKTIQALLDKLSSQGYLDDLAFAKWFVNSRTIHRPRSKRHLSLELRTKGISPEVIDQVLSSYHETDSLSLLIKKKSHLSRTKLLSFLVRRGFSYSIAKSKLDEIGIKE